ncbi:unnamed protein product [Phaedon cochleariae]|uniref:Endonuclease-reverse transcriptase n=1 Tax=Phaedon cochleariae TaxID=80249 RepID=A0A9P0DQ57_PHACE|nr:unnamed protein product [Phaedon cochleariae]
MDDTVKLLKQLTQDINDIKNQNNVIVDQLDGLRQEFKDSKSEVAGELNNLKRENEELKAEKNKLEKRLQAVERKQKKYNLVVYGIQENEIDTHSSITSLFKNKLKVEVHDFGIRDAYRIGKSEENKNRPIVVELLTNKWKTEILNKAKALKGSGIFISLDLIPEDYQKNKFLVTQQKIARESGHSAKIKGKQLIVDGVHYTYDTLRSKHNSVTSETESSEISEEISKKRLAEDSKDIEVFRGRKGSKSLRTSSRIVNKI